MYSRFERIEWIYEDGSTVGRIYEDTETGVQYVCVIRGGITQILDAEGKPYISEEYQAQKLSLTPKQ